MTDSKNSPSFDWLKGEPVGGVNLPEVGEDSIDVKTDSTLSGSSVLDDLNQSESGFSFNVPDEPHLPPAQLNLSDGGTAVLRGGDWAVLPKVTPASSESADESAPLPESQAGNPSGGSADPIVAVNGTDEETTQILNPSSESNAEVGTMPEAGAVMEAPADKPAAPQFEFTPPPPKGPDAVEADPGFAVVPSFSTAKKAAPQKAGSPAPVAKTNSLLNSPADAPPPPKESPSRLPLILLASYASLVTLILLFQLMAGRGGVNTQNLESLPDVIPEASDNLSYIPVNAPLPAGHTLTFGERQRFGNLQVEVLRIAQEPIEFKHYANPQLKREPTAPVWKLWLRFTNVSQDQEFAPLDPHLVLRWVVKVEQQREYSNYYIAPQGAARDAETVQLYRHPPTSDWDMTGQELGRVLKPGESCETYLPSAESGLAELPENLVWRIQIRKGISPGGNGVTTMIEVPFRKKDVG